MSIQGSLERAACNRRPRGLSPWQWARRGLLTLIGAGCLALGSWLLMTIVRPETLGTLSTAQLLGVVVLIVSPVMTLAAIRYDLFVLKTIGTSVYGVHEKPPGEVCSEQRVCLAAHEAHDRSMRREPAPRRFELPARSEKGDGRPLDAA